MSAREAFADVRAEQRQLAADEEPKTAAVVEVELPPAVVDELLEEHGELGADRVSDRLAVRPLVDGDPV